MFILWQWEEPIIRCVHINYLKQFQQIQPLTSLTTPTPKKILWVVKIYFDSFCFNPKYLFNWIRCCHVGGERTILKKRAWARQWSFSSALSTGCPLFWNTTEIIISLIKVVQSLEHWTLQNLFGSFSRWESDGGIESVGRSTPLQSH